MKRECEGHPKITRLCRRLKRYDRQLEMWEAYGLLESIWLFTGKRAPRGDVGRFSNEDIAIGIGYGGDENELIDALVGAGWIDTDPVCRLIIHDWAHHCDDAIHMRLARAKEYFADGTIPRLSRLGRFEREAAVVFYEEVTNSHEYDSRAQTSAQQQQVSAQNGDLCTPPRQSPAPPRPAPPESYERAKSTAPVNATSIDSGKGKRLDVETLPVNWAEWPEKAHGWNRAKSESVFVKFSAYWTNENSAKAVKRNWYKAWQLWCEKEGEHNRGSPHQAPGYPDRNQKRRKKLWP